MPKTQVTQKLVQLKGKEVVIRPICGEDAPRLLAMHERLSADSIYYRYLCAYRPTLHDLRKLERIHDRDGLVLVMALGDRLEQVIGVAYYVVAASPTGTGLNESTTAEWAILVEDEYQGQGLGRMLLQCLIRQAIAKNIRTLHAETDPNNRRVMRLIQGTNMPMKSKMAYGVREVDLQLNPRAAPSRLPASDTAGRPASKAPPASYHWL